MLASCAFSLPLSRDADSTPAVETISDRYIATTNVITDQPDHPVRLCKFALAILVSTSDVLIDEDDHSRGFVKIRVRFLACSCLVYTPRELLAERGGAPQIGMSAGPAVSIAIAGADPRYCLFGDAVSLPSSRRVALFLLVNHGHL